MLAKQTLGAYLGGRGAAKDGGSTFKNFTNEREYEVRMAGSKRISGWTFRMDVPDGRMRSQDEEGRIRRQNEDDIIKRAGPESATSSADGGYAYSD